MTKDEALKLALEALETCYEGEWYSEDDFGLAQTYDENKVDQAIAAIKEALAQPAQEQNFCPRCGKRTQDIHTCTPPQEKYESNNSI